MADALTDVEIEARLIDVPEWSLEGDSIARDLEFDDFNAAIAFINRIAPLADEADHHPEIFNVYNQVELTLTTHDADGLTEKDFALAKRIDGVVNA